jgi:hypothetical protein
MVYAEAVGAVLGVLSVIFAIYADHLADGKRLLLVLAGFLIFIASIWRL